MRTFLLLIRQGDETVEGLMAPWGKEVPIEGHWGDPVTDEEKQDLIDDYKCFGVRNMRITLVMIIRIG